MYLRYGRANELMEFSSIREHDKRNFSITKNSELLCFLENSISSLGVGDLPVSRILNPLDLDLSTTHVLFLPVDMKLQLPTGQNDGI